MAPSNQQTRFLQSEFNNDYTGPAGVGYGGNEESLVRPLLGSGVGFGGADDEQLVTNPGGVGRAGSEEMPAPNRLGGDGRAGLPDDQVHQAPNGEHGRQGSISQPGGPRHIVNGDPDHENSSSAQGTIRPVSMSLGANGE